MDDPINVTGISSLLETYLEHHATLSPDPFCPEIVMWNTAHLAEFWKIASPQTGGEIPYWAIIWPGGRALARFILDHPEQFRHRKILEIGCGSGIVSIAAAMAGGEVTGIDTDPFAVEIAGISSNKNGVSCTFLVADPFREASFELSSYDTILAADLFYDRTLARNLLNLLQKSADNGTYCFVADAMRQHRPDQGLHLLQSYSIPVFREIEGIRERNGTVYSVIPHGTVPA